MKYRCECCGQLLPIIAGTKIRSNITDWNITEGKIYEIKGDGDFIGNVLIINDLGELDEYSLDYFTNMGG